MPRHALKKKALNKAGLCMNHEDHGPWTFDFELAPAWPNLLGVAHSLGLSGSKRSMSSSSFAFARPARTSGKKFFTAVAFSSENSELPSKAMSPQAARSAMV